MLEIHDLNVAYGDAQALWDVGFDVEEGEVYGVIGSNGAGKSTVLRALSGLIRPASGRIEFLGSPVEGRRRPKTTPRACPARPKDKR